MLCKHFSAFSHCWENLHASWSNLEFVYFIHKVSIRLKKEDKTNKLNR
jgi:hypothetical protein